MLIDVPTISLLHFTTTIAASYGNCLTLYNIIFTYPSKLAACFGLVLFCHKKKMYWENTSMNIFTSHKHT